MILGAGPNTQPQDSFLGRVTDGIPRQRTNEFRNQPAHPALRYIPFFDALFGVMRQIEKNMEIYQHLPVMERVMINNELIVPSTEEVDYLFKENKYEVRRYFREVSQRIGGIPVKLAMDEGTLIQGQITDVQSLMQGKWAFSLLHGNGDRPTIFHSADEIRSGYRAAILGEENTHYFGTDSSNPANL